MNTPKISIKSDKKTISLDAYAGEWVGFVDGKVIAHEGTLKKLMEKVKKLRVRKQPSVLLVPKKSEGPYVL